MSTKNDSVPCKLWWHDSVVYQIYPRSFFDSNGDGIGDLNGITMKLDYLKKLGVDILWLSPIYDSPNHDNGYDIRDYFQIMTEFGTMEDFDNMLTEMKCAGLKLIMDLVVNHTSDEHSWFIESRKSTTNLYRDFYHWARGKDGRPPNQWGAAFGGPAWTFDSISGEYYLHTFTPQQPDLNWENPVVREEIYKMMRWWLDKGVDGFRMDVINFISKVADYPEGNSYEGGMYTDGRSYYVNGPRLHEYLQEMHKKVLCYYNIVTVGECPGTQILEAELITSPARKELNMIFTFEHMDLDGGRQETFASLVHRRHCENKWTPKVLNLHELKHHFTAWQKGLFGKGWNSLYWNNHDQPRIVSRWGNDSIQYRVVSAKMLGTCLHFLCGTPYIYQGEEIGMTNVRFASLADYRDIETINFHREAIKCGLSSEEILAAVYAKSRDNARTPMQWSSSSIHGGFTNNGVDVKPWIDVNSNYKDINVEDALNDPSSIFYFYQKLIEMRRKHREIIVYGNYDVLHEDHEYVFIYRRFNHHKQEIIVACNFCRQTVSIDDSLLNERLKSYGHLLISNYDDNQTTNKLNWLDFRPYESWAIELSTENR